jgi:hypothetical protein
MEQYVGYSGKHLAVDGQRRTPTDCLADQTKDAFGTERKEGEPFVAPTEPSLSASQVPTGARRRGKPDPGERAPASWVEGSAEGEAVPRGLHGLVEVPGEEEGLLPPEVCLPRRRANLGLLPVPTESSSPQGGKGDH